MKTERVSAVLLISFATLTHREGKREREREQIERLRAAVFVL
jgi:hypothetical protein